MRKFTILLAMAALAMSAVAESGKLIINGFNKTLYSAKSLSADYTVLTIGGVPHNYSVQLAKPNLAHIDTPTQTIVADGTSIITYDKSQKTYYKNPETDGSVMGLLKGNELSIWQGFFNPNAMQGLPQIEDQGAKVKNGVTYKKVVATMDPSGKRVETFFFDSGNMPHQIEIKLNDDSTTLLTTDSLTVSPNIADPQKLAFKAPDGSRELTMDEANASKWYENLDEALSMAKASHKLVLLEFSATWCGPCQMLAQQVFSTDQFKAESKYFVFCHVDVDEQPGLSAQYKANAIPAIHFLNSDGGEVVAPTIGYGGPESFFGDMEKAKAARNRS